MSGRTKRVLYAVFFAIGALSAVAGVVLIGYFGASAVEKIAVISAVFAVVHVFFPLNVLVHECGHLLFGWLAGMRFVSVAVSHVRISRNGIKWIKSVYAGETQMLPKSRRGIRGKTEAFALGGSLLNLLYGAVFLTLFFAVPVTPVLLFFELCAPLNLFEAFVELFPVKLSAGNTDGEVVRGLIKRTPDAEVFLAVNTAQGILFKGTYGDIPQDVLFSAPVIAEDEPAFLALLQLRWQYLFDMGKTEEALKQLYRLGELIDYLPRSARAEVACDLVYAYAVLVPDAERMEKYRETMDGAKGTCAYFRALAALGEGEAVARAKKANKKQPLRGVRELEDKYLARLSGENQKVLP